MKTCFSINTAALVTLLFLSTPFPIANADILSEYSCKGNGIERIVSLRTQPTSNNLCDVFYEKPDEGIQPVSLWIANSDLNFCKEKIVYLIDKLAAAGWSCQSNTLADPAKKANSDAGPLPQSPTISGGSASRPQMNQGNNGRVSSDMDPALEEAPALLAAQEELSETSIDSVDQIYKDYFDQCYEGSKNDSHNHPFELCNCMVGEFRLRGIDSGTIYSLVHDAEIKEDNGCSNGLEVPGSLVCENLNVAENFESDLFEGCVGFVERR